jgi:sigma-B regulation protein RsbU (phosphoserine phosphatase)
MTEFQLNGLSSLTHLDSLDPDQFVHLNKFELINLPLFAEIPEKLTVQILLKCEYIRLEPMQLLLSPNTKNQYLYVILSGQLSAHINPNEIDKGFRIVTGEVVGEVSIVDNEPPTTYVSALQDCLLLCIHETLLWSDFIQTPGAAKNLLKLITKRSRARNIGIQKSLEQMWRLELIEQELRIAHDLQTNMLPQKPLLAEFTNIEVDAFIKPAKEVGGDLYDAFSLDTNRLCFAIGDVAGKGIPAALFMARSITVLRTEMIKSGDLLQTITAMNSILSQDNPQCMFVTLMICILNTKNGELQYVNGGHNRPLLGRFGSNFSYLQQPQGILVGVNPFAKYELAILQLKPGDLFILYTDGVTEANDSLKNEFSEQRLLEFVSNQCEQPIVNLVSGIWNAVRDFADGADQSDDLTILAVRYR